jgi:uncharacterized protein (TIGR02466 family)
MQVQLSSAFAVPFGGLKHPDPATLNRALRASVLAIEAQGDAFRNLAPEVQQPAGLFESRFELFGRPEPAFQQLRAFCWAALNDFLGQINPRFGDCAATAQITTHTWFHVTRSGGWFGQHNHPMASWSGVYCVDDGAPDPAVPQNGQLVFPHPLTPANAFLDLSNSSLRWPYGHDNLSFDLQPGQLVLFPSWLPHAVTPFHGERERITIAFNAWFTAAGD